MTPEKSGIEIQFEQQIVAHYLSTGSVSSVLRALPGLPYSEPSVHRILNNYDVIRAVGRKRASFSDVLFFFAHLAKENVPLSHLRRKMPPSFAPSAETLQRVYKSVRRNITRSEGVALIITPDENPDVVLIGQDISRPRPWLGKHYGNLSLPMGYCLKNDSQYESIARILQREVFAGLVVRRNFPADIVPDTQAIAEVQILDINIKVYNIILSRDLRQFSSSILQNHKFYPIREILDPTSKDSTPIRHGVAECLQGYVNYQSRPQLQFSPARIVSSLNLDLAHSHLYR